MRATLPPGEPQTWKSSFLGLHHSNPREMILKPFRDFLYYSGAFAENLSEMFFSSSFPLCERLLSPVEDKAIKTRPHTLVGLFGRVKSKEESKKAKSGCAQLPLQNQRKARCYSGVTRSLKDYYLYYIIGFHVADILDCKRALESIKR